MSKRSYKLIRDSAADRFHKSRKPIRIYGGGFGNGKTTALVALTLTLARAYPGLPMMLGRVTYPKLNSTLRKEFFNWCPPAWIKSFNKSDNTLVMHNGTTIDFRYVKQQGSEGESTSNILSANYGFIGFDQADDPDFTEMDFNQLMGRLRGAVEYTGNDPTMPKRGPLWIAMTMNPTLGWQYRRFVKPLQDYKRGIKNADLICDPKTGEPLVDLEEATTYENAQNLPEDFIKNIEAIYTGKMRDRYLLGKWVAFEGVIYNEFDANTHVVTDVEMLERIQHLRDIEQQELTIIEGFDYGIASPSCYGIGLVDNEATVYWVDGFYEPNLNVRTMARKIKAIRRKWAPGQLDNALFVRADPDIFRRKGPGPTVADLFLREGISMVRANNNKLAGIAKVKQHLAVQEAKLNPFTNRFGCPHLFLSHHMDWARQEFETWRWKEGTDEPVDKDDHAMDCCKYMVSLPYREATFKPTPGLPLAVYTWNEAENAMTTQDARSHRYG